MNGARRRGPAKARRSRRRDPRGLRRLPAQGDRVDEHRSADPDESAQQSVTRGLRETIGIELHRCTPEDLRSCQRHEPIAPESRQAERSKRRTIDAADARTSVRDVERDGCRARAEVTERADDRERRSDALSSALERHKEVAIDPASRPGASAGRTSVGSAPRVASPPASPPVALGAEGALTTSTAPFRARMSARSTTTLEAIRVDSRRRSTHRAVPGQRSTPIRRTVPRRAKTEATRRRRGPGAVRVAVARACPYGVCRVRRAGSRRAT